MDPQVSVTEVAGEGVALKNYVLAKQDVADVIRAAKQMFEAWSAGAEVERCQALLVKLAEDRFDLAVVGQFKRGKSSLMNAVIGRDLLPTGLLPLTSAITTLCYGPEEGVFLRWKGWRLEQEIPLSALADYVTEQGNPGNEKGLLEARVVVPMPFLRRGLYFIVIDSTAVKLGEAFEQAPEEAAARVGDLLPSTETCPACETLREMERGWLRDLLDELASTEGERRYAQSPGLCLPHLRAAVAEERSAKAIQFLLREQVRRLEEMSEDLRSYTLKRDALRRGLLNANEEDAWHRALVVLTGERAVRRLWSEEE